MIVLVALSYCIPGLNKMSTFYITSMIEKKWTHGFYMWLFWLCEYYFLIQSLATILYTNKQTNKLTPLFESASVLCRPSDRRLSAKLVPTFADRGCHEVSMTDPYGRVLGFLPFFTHCVLSLLRFACQMNCRTLIWHSWFAMAVQYPKTRLHAPLTVWGSQCESVCYTLQSVLSSKSLFSRWFTHLPHIPSSWYFISQTALHLVMTIKFQFIIYFFFHLITLTVYAMDSLLCVQGATI
jgi:hypothetical protein